MRFLKRYFMPDAIVSRGSDISFDEYYRKGYRFVLLDMDNTIVNDHAKEPSDYTWAIMNKVQKSGMIPCIVSNAKSRRSADFAKILGVSCVSYAAKPSPKGIHRALELIGGSKEKTLFIGDQLFTDIAAAKRAGVFCIFVEPLSKKEVLHVGIKRPFEWVIRTILRY